MLCRTQLADAPPVAPVCLLLLLATHSHADGDKPKAPADFAVEFEHRSSDKLKRGDVIDIVAKAVPQPPYKVGASTTALPCAAGFDSCGDVSAGLSRHRVLLFCVSRYGPLEETCSLTASVRGFADLLLAVCCLCNPAPDPHSCR